MASRAQVAAFLADKLETNREGGIQSVAAWLVDHKGARQAEYLTRDVARIMGERGYVLARVTTARPLSESARADVEAYIRTQTNARQVELELSVDPAVMGGVRIELPDSEIDATVRHKLTKLIEGVSR